MANTQYVDEEFLTVLTKDFRLIVDLIAGNENEVNLPLIAKMEGEKENILMACHNHFFGAVIPSLDDVGTTLNHNCLFTPYCFM